MMMTRRDFVAASASAAATWAVQPSTSVAQQRLTEPDWPVAIFEKAIQSLGYDDLADAVDRIGADGIEAAIRPGGHIEPAVAAEEVPRMVEALGRKGKRVIIAATHVNRADAPETESFLRTLKQNGIHYYRTGYYRYDPGQPLKRQVQEFAAMARDLAALNNEVGILGVYQNHAGAKYLGSLAWDLAYILNDVNPDALGVALDLRHLRADTGTSWKTAVAALKPHIRAIFVKDALWTGPRTDVVHNVPLGQGFATKEVFDFVRQGLSPMPLSIHMEHMAHGILEPSEIPEGIKAYQNDVAVLRSWLTG